FSRQLRRCVGRLRLDRGRARRVDEARYRPALRTRRQRPTADALRRLCRLRMERVSAGHARWRCPLRARPRRYLCDDYGSTAMTMVFAGACSHAPGITGRAQRADPVAREQFYRHYDELRVALTQRRPDALVVIAAKHFANFFMNNMPA